MPATAAHAFFAEDVFTSLNKECQQLLRKNRKSFLMFAQGMDPMMFYNILSLKKGKELRGFSYTFHTTKINVYFKNIISYIKKNHYYNDSQTLAYLYGIVCHYALDSTIHPFIFYKTGEYKKENKETLKYNSLHTYMETFIDNVMIRQRGYTNKEFSFKKLCFDFKDFSNQLQDTIKSSFEDTYHICNMDKIYKKSLKQMCLILHLFRLDSFGIKKFFYQVIDFLTPKTMMRFASISYYHVEDLHDYLNLLGKKWCYPTNQEIKSQKTFFELYDEAISKAITIIKQINDYFFLDHPISIEELFQNKSYLTGVDCSLKDELRYFEF